MSKQVMKPGTMVYPVPAVMVTCGDSIENYNIITIAWTGTVNSMPPMTYVSVRKERHSHALIERTKEFVINLTTEDLAKATDFCGVKSGREVNKFEHLGLTPVPGEHVKAPLIAECPVNIECRVTQVLELGSHDMFIAEVLAVHVDNKLMDASGKIHLEWSKPICYSHGEYFGLGDSVGKFGYSIMRPKTAKQYEKEKAVEKRAKEKSELRKKKGEDKAQAREEWQKNQSEWLENKQRKEDRKAYFREQGKKEVKEGFKPFTGGDSSSFTKSRSREDAKPYNKGEGKSYDKGESKSYTKTDSKPYSKSDSKPYAKSDSKPYAKSDAKPYSKSEGKPYAKSENKSYSKPEGKPFNKGPAKEGRRSATISVPHGKKNSAR